VVGADGLIQSRLAVGALAKRRGVQPEQLGLILGGNKYFASKLNEARDILLGQGR
jgi:hypothetical protein